MRTHLNTHLRAHINMTYSNIQKALMNAGLGEPFLENTAQDLCEADLGPRPHD